MVLGFGSKKKKEIAEPVFIRASPSLPELYQQRIPWPEDFIDSNVVDDAPAASEGHGGARKTSFSATRGGPAIPFHKPFRAGDAAAAMPGTPVSTHTNKSVPPPSAYAGPGGVRSRAGSHPRANRRAKNPPTFNVMVAGAKHTGKSSLLRLILDTSTISPASTQEQLISLATFRTSASRPTTGIAAASIEILQALPGRTPTLEDRVALTCIDTPGLDFAEGKEFALDRAVSEVVKYVDLQFAETLGEESKVVRTSKGDQHVHLCIYLIDPDAVMTPSARRARSRLSTAIRGQPLSPTELPEPSEYDSGSEDDDDDEEGSGGGGGGDNATAAASVNHGGDSDDGYGAPEPVRAPLTPISPDEATPRNSVDVRTPPKTRPPPAVQSQAQNRLVMSAAEIRVIARLAKRVNVLPVIARADTLTDGRLARIKRAIRRDLQDVGVSVDADDADEGVGGIFAVWDAEPGALFGRRGSSKENNKRGNGHAVAEAGEGYEDDGEDDAQERAARPVIKLRDRKLTRSRSRKSLKSAVGEDYNDPPGGAAKAATGGERPVSAAPSVSPSRRSSVASAGPGAGAGVGATGSYSPAFSRGELRARMPFAIIAPERGRGKDRAGVASAGASSHGHGSSGTGAGAGAGMGPFVRRFRWGTIDVLDPQHCDFAALRAAVLGSYMRALKTTTKDVLYERFRTEKLLARRATRNISDAERKRIFNDLKL